MFHNSGDPSGQAAGVNGNLATGLGASEAFSSAGGTFSPSRATGESDTPLSFDGSTFALATASLAAVKFSPAPPPASATAPASAPASAPAPAPASAPASAPPASTSLAGPVSTSGSAVAKSQSPKPLYVPQFTAATQMILNRIRGDSGGLSSALASAASSTPRAAIQPSTYEDVRRRLLTGMSTSTMQMPGPAPAAASAPTAPAASVTPLAVPSQARTQSVGPLPTPRPAQGLSAIQRVNAGLTGRARGKVAKPAPTTPASPASASKKPRLSTDGAAGGAGGGPLGAKAARISLKRKRLGSGLDDYSDYDSDGSPFSELESPPDAGPGGAGGGSSGQSATSTLLTTTKSGRQVQKPTTYNPAAMDAAAGSRRRQSQRSAGELVQAAMCRLCSRLAYTPTNELVFCDGCNDAWHQSCHDPPIDQAFVADHKRAWHCATCTTRAERQATTQQTKKSGKAATVAAPPPPNPHARVSWAGRTPGQKRAYLTGLSNAELIEMVMRCTELQPNLAIFPSDENAIGKPSTDDFLSGPSTAPQGGTNFTTHNVSSFTSLSSASTSVVPRRIPDDGTWDDPTGLLEAWKRPQAGGPPVGRFAAQLQMLQAGSGPGGGGGAHLEDADDFASFSQTVFDRHGRKVPDRTPVAA